MSTCLRETADVRSMRRRRCSLCEEWIEAGDPHFVRVGLDCGDLWEMRIHRECHVFEREYPLSDDWYRFPDGPAFSRTAAIDAARAKEGQRCQCTNGVIRSVGRDNDEVIEDCPNCSGSKEAKP